MIEIRKSSTADTRTCDVSTVDKATLLESSRQHIGDVAKALSFFAQKLFLAAAEHDYDKLTDIDWFYADFKTKFEQTGWWDNHRKIHRHHLAQQDGIPIDVNLIDVIEYISDCVVAGMARSGEVYEIVAPDELLRAAFNNTVAILKDEVDVVDPCSCTPIYCPQNLTATIGDESRQYIWSDCDNAYLLVGDVGGGFPVSLPMDLTSVG